MTRFTRWDMYLILGLFVAALAALGIMRYVSGGAAVVVAQVDGVEVIRKPLNQDETFVVKGQLGNTEVEIKDGRVRVIDSPCRNKTCVHNGWISKPYQTIICAPNHVTIHLLGGGNRETVDGITE